MLDSQPRRPASATSPALATDLSVSVAAGIGLDELKQRITQRLLGSSSSRGDLLASTAARCRDSLRQAEDALKSAADATMQGLGEELISIEIRHCLHAVGQILGEVYTDDILDHIFSSFCIGK